MSSSDHDKFVTCPYCSHKFVAKHHPVRAKSLKVTSAFIEHCDGSDGGCDRFFALKWRVVFIPKSLKIEGEDEQEAS